MLVKGYIRMYVLSRSAVSESAIPETTACQAPLSMEFARQEYWSGLPFSSPGDLLDPGIEPTSLRSPALAGGFFTISATWEIPIHMYILYIKHVNTL